MTVNQIEPALGENYRQRGTGRVAKLMIYTPAHVLLTGDNKTMWSGLREDFWNEWIHSGASHEQVNRRQT